RSYRSYIRFLFCCTATPEVYTLSLHDALPICIDLFVEKMGAIIGATQEGQIQLRELIRDRLQRVQRDPKGVPEKIVLFTAPSRRSEEHTSELQSQSKLVCRLLLEKKQRHTARN